MPVVSFAKNQSVTTIFGTTMEFTTDPVPLGAANYGQAALNIESMFATAGSGSLTWQIQGADDGVHFQDLSTANDTQTTSGLSEKEVELFFPFLRVKFSFDAGASGTDWGSIVFDFRVNLLRK